MRISELAVDAVFTPSWLAHAIVRLTRRVDRPDVLAEIADLAFGAGRSPAAASKAATSSPSGRLLVPVISPRGFEPRRAGYNRVSRSASCRSHPAPKTSRSGQVGSRC